MRITIWQTLVPAELKRQLAEFERRFEQVKGTVEAWLKLKVLNYNVANEFESNVSNKVTAATNDRLLIEDSADSYSKKWVSISALPSGGGGGFTTAGAGLLGTGSTIDIQAANATIVVNADSIERAAISGDVSIPAGSNTATIQAAAVTLSKIQTVATDTLLGRDTAGTGTLEAITLNSTLAWSGSQSIGRAAISGDVTIAAGSNTAAITAGVIVDGDINASAAIANSKLANVSGSRLIGNPTGAAAARSEISLDPTLLFSGTSLQRAAISGDVTIAAGSNSATVTGLTIASQAHGDILYRGASAWVRLPAGTSGQYLQTQGTGANPVWATVAGGGGSTFLDNAFRVQDNTDATKQLAFEVSAIATATTRTVYSPNSDVDLTNGFAWTYEDFTRSVVSATASTNNAIVGDTTFQNASAGTWSHLIATLDANRPGILRLGLPATANAVASIVLAPHLSKGGEFFYWIFRTPSTFTNLTVCIGQVQTATAVTTEPTDGIYLFQTAGTSTFGFKSANASTRTVGTTTTLTTSTWYGFSIRWNDARTQAVCTLYNGTTGAVIITQTLTTNLPGTGTVLYARANVWTSAAAAVAAALDLDLIRVRFGSPTQSLSRPQTPGDWTL